MGLKTEVLRKVYRLAPTPNFFDGSVERGQGFFKLSNRSQTLCKSAGGAAEQKGLLIRPHSDQRGTQHGNTVVDFSSAD